jgi:hypothetical protein
MMTSAEYRAKASSALLQAGAATTPDVHKMYIRLAAEWTALSVTAATQEGLERDLKG